MGSLSAADLQDAFCEFLEALVHQTLCLREIYSPELFEKQRLYSIVVRRARHPELAKYIHHAIDSLKVCCDCGGEKRRARWATKQRWPGDLRG